LRRVFNDVVPRFTRDIQYYLFGRNRPLILLVKVISWVRRRAIRPLLDSFALKWFCPGLRARILPFFVTRRRFEYDLFVFMFVLFCTTFIGFDDSSESFWTFLYFVGYLI